MADREVVVRLRLDISQYQRDAKMAAAETVALGRATDGLNSPLVKTEGQAKRTGNEIDKLSGRLRVMTDALLIGAPALTAFGAGAVGGLVALSAQLGATVGAIGVTVLATKGLGDGLEALDKYQLEPTAENFKKLQQEMKKVGPAGEEFIRFLDSIEPNLKTLQTAAREGLLPGAEEGIEGLLQRLPEVRKLIRLTAEGTGNLLAGGGAEVGGERFDAFFEYLRTDGIKILDDTGKAMGNLALATANTFAAFGGTSMDFSGGLLEFTRGLAEASAGLESDAGFQEFLDYIETEGPHALDTLGSIGNALLQIVEATAPLGGPVLSALGTFADIVAKIADSDIGTPIFGGLAALALLNRSLAVTTSLQTATFGGPAVARMKGYVAGLTEVTSAQQRAQMSAADMDAANATAGRNWGKLAIPAAGLAASMSGVADSVGLSNTAMLAVAGPWGAAAGYALDLWHATDGLEASIDGLNAAMDSGDLLALNQQIDTAHKQLKGIDDDLQNQSFAESLLGPFAGIQDVVPRMGELTGKTDDLRDTLARAEDSAARLAEADERIASGATAAVGPLRYLRVASESNAEAADKQATAIRGAIDAMHSMREESLRAVNAELNYQAAIDDATAAVKENGRTHDKTTEKGRANLQALYNLAGAWNGQSEVIKGNSKLLQDARDNFVKVAGSMGISAGAARKLSRELFDIPEARQTKITVETGQADAALRALKARMDSIRNKTVTVTANVRQQGGQAGGAAVATQADGGTVPKTGKGYADRHLYLLADGEEVISNRHGQADRHRALLKSINAGRRMAQGGTAGVRHSQVLTSAYGAEIADPAHGVAQALRLLQEALKKSEKALDKESQKRDDLQSQFDSIRSSVGSAYSTLDPFAAASSSGSIWGSSAQSPLAMFDAALSGNIASTSAAQSALGTAAGNGLNGPLYAALAASGNLSLLQAFAGLSASEIQSREDQFAAQSNAQSALGTMAASQQVGPELAAANKSLVDIRSEVRDLRGDVKTLDRNNQKAQKQNAKDVKDGVNGAAASGHRRGR